MTERTITDMEAQLLGAAALFTVGYTLMGKPAAQSLRKLEEQLGGDRAAATRGSMLLLSQDRLVNLDDFVGIGPQGSLTANLHKLGKLGTELLRFSGARVAAPAPEAPKPPRVIDVTPDGTPVVEGDIAPPVDPAAKKLYTLQLTHDEIHLMFWAFSVAEAAYQHDAFKLFENQDVYARVRDDELGKTAVDNFIEKFDAAHAIARLDDGE